MTAALKWSGGELRPAVELCELCGQLPMLRNGEASLVAEDAIEPRRQGRLARRGWMAARSLEAAVVNGQMRPRMRCWAARCASVNVSSCGPGVGVPPA